MTTPHHHLARLTIDSITLAMSNLATLERADDSLGGAPWAHLDDARRALIAKYQLQEHGR